MKRKRSREYRGRIAPSPSGHLHVGHAQTFWIAKERSRKYHGKLLLRVEDIDIQRCKPHYLPDMIEDLKWFGIDWDEGYDHSTTSTILNPFNQFIQSKRFSLYIKAWKLLYDKGFVYPCKQSRRDVAAALSAPHDKVPQKTVAGTVSVDQPSETKKASEDIGNEPIFPPSLRPPFLVNIPYGIGNNQFLPPEYENINSPLDTKVSWRFRVPDDRRPIRFVDGHFGEQAFISGEDFGDFLVWRSDGYPSYELAVVVDDILMRITEVVRGQDLLISTARQLLLIQAIFGLDFDNVLSWNDANGEVDIQVEEELTVQEAESNEILSADETISTNETVSIDFSLQNGGKPLKGFENSGFIENNYFSIDNQYRIPSYYHLPLVCDENGVRLAKRNFAKSLRNLREEGMTPDQIRNQFFQQKLPI